jgi:tRNA A-37 threonylcarbamoyl transferase component Bud32
MGSTTLVLAGRYRLAEPIAGGGVGEVWRGHDTVLDRVVAVKLLRPEYVQHPQTLARFRAEARHAARVTHPGIAQVYDYGEDDQPFLVMELVDGPSLAGVLAAGPLDVGMVMDVVAQTATALGAAHAAGLVHRDVKPTNLLLAPGGQVKITDFGIAYAAGSAPLTGTGTLIGTPAYLAPERVAGRPATPASDLYSLGIVCYECLTGNRPFTGTPVEVALAHTSRGLPALPPQVPAEAAALVASLTAKDPAARPASAADAAREAARLRDAFPASGWAVTPGPAVADPLPATLVGEPSQITTGTRPYPDTVPVRVPMPPRRTAGRKRVLAWTVGAAAVALGLAVWGLAGGLGAAHPARSHTGPTAASATPASPRLVPVSSAALTGQPVDAIRRQLRELGLRVQVVWRYSGHQQPGTVISVQPTGRLPAGTRVVVTGALTPPGHGHKDGGGNDHGNGNGGGQGD